MKITLSMIKADIGSVGGHTKPSQRIMDAIKKHVGEAKSSGLIIDYDVTHTGDDVAILMSHTRGENDEKVHELAWNAFSLGAEIAKEQGLYGAGQDLLADAFSGNVKGLGPAAAEIEVDERPSEAFIVFAADKTEPGAYNLPLYLSFADPMHCAGLLLSPVLTKGFTFTIMDVSHTEGDRVVKLRTPEDMYRIAALLRDPNRYVVESIHSNHTGEKVASVSTSRLHNIAGTYTGKDDPVCIVRVQKDFPATGEVLHPYAIVPYVSGFSRGSHTGPLMPVKVCTATTYFDGPPLVSAVAYSMHNGVLAETSDLFDHVFWDEIRKKATQKALAIREQGFYGNAMLGISELEYGGIKNILKELDSRFVVREKEHKPAMQAEKGRVAVKR